MKGAYEFLVTVKPSTEDSCKMVIDARCVVMNNKRDGYVNRSSWVCNITDGPKVIETTLVEAWKWLSSEAKPF